MNISDLLHEAVDGIEPADRIAEIRSRTADPARSAARPWFYAAGAAALATAATVAAFAVLDDDSAPDVGPSHHAHEHDTVLVAAYFVGDTPQGERLFREFDEVEGADELAAALERIQQPATDPDYRTVWKSGSFESVALNDEEGTIDVEIGPAPAEDIVTLAGELPVQQVIYTVRGALAMQGDLGSDWPLRFVQDGEPVLTIDALPQNDVLSQVSISDPAEGAAYEGSFIARGRANSFEATVPWEIRDGDTVVADGFATAAGFGDRLYEWETEVDLSGIAPGEYTFVAMTSDPSGGAEGAGPFVDTRTIVVR